MKKATLKLCILSLSALFLSGCSSEEPTPVEVVDDSGFPVLEGSKYPTMEEFNEKIVGKVWKQSWKDEDVMTIKTDGTLIPGHVVLICGDSSSTIEFSGEGKMYTYSITGGGAPFTGWPVRYESEYTYEPSTGIVKVDGKAYYRIVEVAEGVFKAIAARHWPNEELQLTGYYCYNFYKSDKDYTAEPDPMSKIDKLSFDENEVPLAAYIKPLSAEEFQAKVVGSHWEQNYTYTIKPGNIRCDGTILYGLENMPPLPLKKLYWFFKDDHTVVVNKEEKSYSYDPATGIVAIVGEPIFRLVDVDGDMLRYIYQGSEREEGFNETGYFLLRMERMNE